MVEYKTIEDKLKEQYENNYSVFAPDCSFEDIFGSDVTAFLDDDKIKALMPVFRNTFGDVKIFGELTMNINHLFESFVLILDCFIYDDGERKGYTFILPINSKQDRILWNLFVKNKTKKPG